MIPSTHSKVLDKWVLGVPFCRNRVENEQLEGAEWKGFYRVIYDLGVFEIFASELLIR